MSIIKQSVKSSFINYVGILLGAFFTLYLTPKYLTTEYNGLYRLLLEYATIIATYAHFGIPLIINKYYHLIVGEGKESKGFDFFIFGFPLILFSVIAIVFFLCKDLIVSLIASKSDYWLISRHILFIIPIFLCNSYLLIQKNYLAMLGNITFVTFIQNVFLKVFNILAVVVFVFTANFEWSMWLIVLSNLLGVFFIHLKIMQLMHWKIKLRPSVDFLTKNNLARSFIYYFLFIIVSNVTGFFITRIDLFFVAKYTDLSNVAYYTTAVFFVVFIMVPYSSVLSISFPLIVKNYTENNYQVLKKLVKDNAMFGLVLSTFCFFLIWWNIDLIYHIIPRGEIYKEGKYVFLILALGKLIDISIGSVGQLIVSSRWYYYTLIFSVFNAIIGVGLGYYFTVNYGILGSALAITITLLMSDVFQVLLVWNKLKILPYDIKIFKLILIGVLIFFLSYMLDVFFEDLYVLFVIKNILFSILFFVAVYMFNLSEQVKGLLNYLLMKLRCLFT